MGSFHTPSPNNHRTLPASPPLDSEEQKQHIHNSAIKIINNEERSTLISSSSSSRKQQQQQQPQTSQRLLSLDVFRGLTVAVFSLYLPYFAL